MPPRISIIIPVYNTAPYLRRCLDSVCGQTLQDIEIICINDASPDNSLGLLNEYAGCDSRIHVINFSHNRGVSAARNAGVAVARGKYLGFVDSDDAVDDFFFQRLCDKAEKTDALIVKGVRMRISDNGVMSEQPLNDKVRQDRLSFGHQWQSAIYKTDVIRDNGISFPIGINSCEDVAFLVKAVSLSHHVPIQDNAYYYYYSREQSLSSGIFEHERILSKLCSRYDIVSFLNSRKIDEQTYDVLYFKNLSGFLPIIEQGFPEDRAKNAFACAETAVRIYASCRRRSALNAKLRGNGMYDFLRKADVAGLAHYLQHKPGMTKRSYPGQVAASLHARLVTAKEADRR